MDKHNVVHCLAAALVLFCSPAFGSPTNTISLDSATTQTTISSSDYNSNLNEISTKYAAHDHQDSTKTTSNTYTIGNGNAGNKDYAIDNDTANDPKLRHNGTQWTVTQDGTNFATINTTSGTTVSHFQFPASPSSADIIFSDGSSWQSGVDRTNDLATGAGEIFYSTGADAVTVLAAGTSGTVLQSGGAGAPSWVASPIDVENTLVFYDDFVSLSSDATGGGGAALRAIDSQYRYLIEGENAGTNQGVGGIVSVQSDGTRNGVFFIYDGTGAATSDFVRQFIASKNPVLRVRFRNTGNIAAKDNWLGLAEQANAPDGAEPTEGVFMHNQDGATGFRGGTKNDSDEEFTSGLEAADTDWHEMSVSITSSAVTYTWDGAVQTALTQYIPNGNMGFFCTDQATTDAQGTDIDYVYITQDR